MLPFWNIFRYFICWFVVRRWPELFSNESIFPLDDKYLKFQKISIPFWVILKSNFTIKMWWLLLTLEIVFIKHFIGTDCSVAKTIQFKSRMICSEVIQINVFCANNCDWNIRLCCESVHFSLIHAVLEILKLRYDYIFYKKLCINTNK